MPASLSNRRLVAAASLALTGAYAAIVGVEAARSGVAFDAVQFFPLGSDSGASLPGRALALIMGLLLGWGVPGLQLALQIRNPASAPLAVLGRAFGLGFGYILITGAGYAVLAGHAPHRTIFLILLSLPGVVTLASRDSADRSDRRLITTCGAAVLAMGVVTGALWPHLRTNALNGDGTEVYELARSLDAHTFPRWDLEGEGDGRFGIPVVAPYFTGAYFTFGEMTILGRGELAARIPFVLALVLLAATAMGLVRTRSRLSWLYVAAVATVFALWHTYYVTYERPFPEIAAAAGSDTLTIALWLAGFHEVTKGATSLGVAFMVLAGGVRYAAPVLAALTLVPLWLMDRAKGRAFLRSMVIAGVATAAAVGLLAWASGDWDQWVRQIREEYLNDYTTAAGTHTGGWLLKSLILMTGALPIIAIINWRALSATSRTLLVVGLLYLGVILAGGEKHLHYLTPLPWILLPAAVDASSDRWRWATGGAIAVLALAFAFSWPAAGQARTENADLGRQSCVQGFDYETAALRSGGIYAALDQPPRSGRFAIGKHTFVRYALDLGGTDCVLGLSLAPPVGAILLVDGPAALWTTDPDRYAAWRFRQVAVPVSRLFPFATASPLPAKAGDWLGRQDLEQPRGRALILSVSTPAGAQAGTVQMRLLAPVAGPRRELVLGLAAPAAGRLQFSVNGGRLSATPLTRGEQTVGVWAGDLRDGWNVLTLGLASGVALRWLEGR